MVSQDTVRLLSTWWIWQAQRDRETLRLQGESMSFVSLCRLLGGCQPTVLHGLAVGKGTVNNTCIHRDHHLVKTCVSCLTCSVFLLSSCCRRYFGLLLPWAAILFAYCPFRRTLYSLCLRSAYPYSDIVPCFTSYSDLNHGLRHSFCGYQRSSFVFTICFDRSLSCPHQASVRLWPS